MNTLVDVHTHTIMSGHAFSTLQEMVTEGKKKGLEILGIVEHGPSIPGTCDPIYFRNIHVVPRQYDGMRLLLGAELNILNTRGELDLSDFYYERMDFRIAGIHSLCWEGGTRDENTAGVINAIHNPRTNIISHPGDGAAELHYEPIVLAAKTTHTLLEINSASMRPIRGFSKAKDYYIEILNLCKKHDVPVILGSDAHIACDISNFEHCIPLLAETEFPETLIMNDKPQSFLEYLGI